MHFFRQPTRGRRKRTIRRFRARNVLDSKARRHQNKYLDEVRRLRETCKDWDELYSMSVQPDERMSQLSRIDVVGGFLAAQYAWAIPNEKALRILSNFSPLVEVGAGKGYWASLLRDRGVDILAYDIHVHASDNFTKVLKGGPKKLLEEACKGRNLFLCYPDENSSLAQRCLENFDGEYIIHVGELIISGGTKCCSRAPWGRTSSGEFQLSLSEEFHCLLMVKLPRFPFANDYLSVWKRTKWVEVDDEEDSDESDSDTSDSEVDEEEEMRKKLWASIPNDEILMHKDVAAPCLQHLLDG